MYTIVTFTPKRSGPLHVFVFCLHTPTCIHTRFVLYSCTLTALRTRYKHSVNLFSVLTYLLNCTHTYTHISSFLRSLSLFISSYMFSLYKWFHSWFFTLVLSPFFLYSCLTPILNTLIIFYRSYVAFYSLRRKHKSLKTK